MFSVFLTVSSAFGFKIRKKCLCDPNFFSSQTSLLISKTPERDVDFESVEKITKNSCKKSYQQKSNEKIVDLYYCVQKFSAYNFCFGVTFLHFCNWFEKQHKILCFKIKISTFSKKKFAHIFLATNFHF
jgi:hypothetical protein